MHNNDYLSLFTSHFLDYIEYYKVNNTYNRKYKQKNLKDIASRILSEIYFSYKRLNLMSHYFTLVI
ncbi:hypothetical protein V1477_008680 [Vespula maculifrons]|uniref:Uncharacterized protein n=1 Tax=Vespula maculifrons TaxID=7453 RepID=A0ABD2CDQ8_VESMC